MKFREGDTVDCYRTNSDKSYKGFLISVKDYEDTNTYIVFRLLDSKGVKYSIFFGTDYPDTKICTCRMVLFEKVLIQKNEFRHKRQEWKQ